MAQMLKLLRYADPATSECVETESDIQDGRQSDANESEHRRFAQGRVTYDRAWVEERTVEQE